MDAQEQCYDRRNKVGRETGTAREWGGVVMWHEPLKYYRTSWEAVRQGKRGATRKRRLTDGPVREEPVTPVRVGLTGWCEGGAPPQGGESRGARRKGHRPWVRSQVVGQMYRACIRKEYSLHR